MQSAVKLVHKNITHHISNSDSAVEAANFTRGWAGGASAGARGSQLEQGTFLSGVLSWLD